MASLPVALLLGVNLVILTWRPPRSTGALIPGAVYLLISNVSYAFKFTYSIFFSISFDFTYLSTDSMS